MMLHLIALPGVLATATPVSAQAWVPAKGDGAVAIAVQQLNVKKHLAGTTQTDAGHTNTFVVLADLTYGLTDKVAVDLALPFVSTKYSGTKPHPNTSIDDGTAHSAFTDFRVAVRYNLTRKGAVVTPYVGTVVPSHGYAYYGHSAFGQRLREVQVGTYVAKLFTSGLPNTFVSARVGYGFVEKVQDISHNRSSGDLEVGYFVTPAFRTFGMASGQYTHGGIQFPAGGLAAVPAKYKLVHDVVQQVSFLNLGAGFAYSVRESFDVFGSFTRQVAGRNGHLLNRGVTMGASWSFSARKRGEAVAANIGAPGPRYARATGRREGSLLRCICQKSGA
jgi:hypothetical protein